MNQRSIACKAFVMCMVLFCAYMQWSPSVDLDYVWLDGHEHYVGAANPHPMGKVVVPTLLQPVNTPLEFFAPQLLPLPVEESMARLAPAPAMRL